MAQTPRYSSDFDDAPRRGADATRRMAPSPLPTTRVAGPTGADAATRRVSPRDTAPFAMPPTHEMHNDAGTPTSAPTSGPYGTEPTAAATPNPYAAPARPAASPYATPAPADQTVADPRAYGASPYSAAADPYANDANAYANSVGLYTEGVGNAPYPADQTVVDPRAYAASADPYAQPARAHAGHGVLRRNPASPTAPEGAQPHAPHPRKRARHGCLSLVLWLVMLVVVAFLVIRLLPSEQANGSMVPELVSFVPLMLVPSAVCLALALLWRRRLLAIVCVLALGLNGWWHAGYFTPATTVSTAATSAVAASATTDDAYARVMTLNTMGGYASAKQIVQICREKHIEVLCLQELNDAMLQDLADAGIDEVFPYHVVSAGASAISNGGRNGIWTVAPQDDVSHNLLPIETSSMPAASVTIGGRAVRVVAVHPNSPVRGAQDLWDAGLSVIGQLSGYGHAYLIMGDFNSTWDHARFRELLGTAFADASETAGEGLHMTYPANSLVPPVIEIDHIVYARNVGLAVGKLETVEVSGTDHLALIGTLEVS